jgi:hypothetical protein
MSKYVTHKHGLVIGSDNYFFVVDRAGHNHRGEPDLVLPEGVADLRDGYRAIVSFNSYHFDQYDTLNVFVETPAAQLVWRRKMIKWTMPWENKGETINLPYRRDYYVLSDWMVRWLEEVVGPRYDRWDTYTRADRSSRNVFFKRRKDALAFVNLIKRELAGIKINDW